MTAQAATEFGKRALSYERDITDALLEKAGALVVLLRLPVPAMGVRLVRQALGRLREGQAVVGELEQEALRDAVTRAVEEYEVALREKQARRIRRSAGEDASPEMKGHAVLSPMEKEAVEAFCLWTVLESVRRDREGYRAADVDRAGELLDP